MCSRYRCGRPPSGRTPRGMRRARRPGPRRPPGCSARRPEPGMTSASPMPISTTAGPRPCTSRVAASSTGGPHGRTFGEVELRSEITAQERTIDGIIAFQAHLKDARARSNRQVSSSPEAMPPRFVACATTASRRRSRRRDFSITARGAATAARPVDADHPLHHRPGRPRRRVEGPPPGGTPRRHVISPCGRTLVPAGYGRRCAGVDRENGLEMDRRRAFLAVLLRRGWSPVAWQEGASRVMRRPSRLSTTSSRRGR